MLLICHLHLSVTCSQPNLNFVISEKLVNSNNAVMLFWKIRQVIYMVVKFETTTAEIGACILHDLTAKIIWTSPVYRFVLQVHKIILKKTTQNFKLFCPRKKKKNKRTTSEFTSFVGTKVVNFVSKKKTILLWSSQFSWWTDKFCQQLCNSQNLPMNLKTSVAKVS